MDSGIEIVLVPLTVDSRLPIARNSLAAPAVTDFTARPCPDRRLHLATGDLFSLDGDPACVGGDNLLSKGVWTRHLNWNRAYRLPLYAIWCPICETSMETSVFHTVSTSCLLEAGRRTSQRTSTIPSEMPCRDHRL